MRAPLIEECYAILECKVVDTKLSTKYNLFICEVLKACLTAHRNIRAPFIIGQGHVLPSTLSAMAIPMENG